MTSSPFLLWTNSLRIHHILFVLFLFAALDCISEPKKTVPLQPIEQIIARHSDSLMAINGVVGVGQSLCDAKPCIKVFIAEDSKEIRSKIPTSLGGYRVSIEVSGVFKAR